MWENYYSVVKIEQALDCLDSERENARIIAGGTDLILELKQGIRNPLKTLIDINHIAGFRNIWMDENNYIHIKAGATHNDCVASKLICDNALPLAQACYGIGSPQIRNVATIVGNLITASPANDTISALIALDATIIIRSKSGLKDVRLSDFYTGVRKTILSPSEMVDEIIFKKIPNNSKGVFNRYLLRKTHAISLVNSTIIVTLNEEKISKAIITLGCVAPTIVRAFTAEEFLIGKELNNDVIEECSVLAVESARPISDIRSSDKYRNRLVKVIISLGLKSLLKNEISVNKIKNPILLSGKDTSKINKKSKAIFQNQNSLIDLHINKKKYSLKNSKGLTLLDLIRDKAGLTGTKLGCGEGECGACTIFLDELAVLSCLIPASRAQDSHITTIEGVSENGELNNMQKAFIDEGAVQCGYCTPGFIMSAIKLLEEIPSPTIAEIKEGLAGNLCRCTGYYRIIAAVEKAAKMSLVEEK